MSRTEIPVNVDVQSSNDETLEWVRYEACRAVEGVPFTAPEVWPHLVKRFIAATADAAEVTALRQQVEQLRADNAVLQVELDRRGIGEIASGWTNAEWEEWSNELADLLPEEYDGDEAQESIILSAVADMTAALADRDAKLAAVEALHKRIEVEGQEGLCIAGDCNHPECANGDDRLVMFAVCGHCMGLAELSNYGDWDGEQWPGDIMWPCATARVLAPNHENAYFDPDAAFDSTVPEGARSSSLSVPTSPQTED